MSSNDLHACAQDLTQRIAEDAQRVIDELLQQAHLAPGSILVVGCSSSEMAGGHIGKYSSMGAARAAFAPIYNTLVREKIYLAAQCCEHLNRALVIEREAAQQLGLPIVCVMPQPKAGGSFATLAYETMRDPVVVEQIRADAGLDIGGTLIGMHLKAVAVPVRLSIDKIGCAHILCARTRPKYIGGARAVYPEN